MTPNQFSNNLYKAIQSAQGLAIANGNKLIEPIHLLNALVNLDQGFIGLMFEDKQTQLATVKSVIQQFINQLPKENGPISNAELSRNSSQILLRSQGFQETEGASVIDVGHVIKAMLSMDGSARSVLLTFNIKEEDVNETATKHLHDDSGDIEQEDGGSALKKYAVDLVDLARNNQLDPVIGRDEETRRVIQILSRRMKNNPIIVGEAGVGKTALCEGLAQRIADGDVPSNLKDRAIYSLNLSAIKAGAVYQGDLETRLKEIIQELVKSQGKFILFIDEIHTIVSSENSGASIADVLKPELDRGKIRIIGATTLNEYQKSIEKDSALERRFQRVLIEEPSEELCITILRGLKERYENHHKVQIKDEALVLAVRLAKRYMPFRALPDSAIDLLDEACSKIRIEINSKPTELDRVERSLITTKINLKFIDEDSLTDKEIWNSLKKKEQDLEQEKTDLTYKWKREKNLIDKIQTLKAEHEKLVNEKTDATKSSKIEKAADLSVKISANETSINELKQELSDVQKEHKLIREEVAEKEIEEVVADKTGISVSRIEENEFQKLLDIESTLDSQVIGQTEAISEIAKSIRVNRVPGMGNKNRPIGSFMFLGTTGVGKTFLAKKLAEYLFFDEDAMVRIDMSEYSEKHTVSRLIGAPPGYVGYEEGGQLTEPVRNKPFCILLLDEIEKAHPEMWNILLQILDDGRATDSQGREVNFKNVIIIMTSNIGSTIIQENFDENNNEISQEMIATTKADVFEEVKQQLKPEVLNRIDELIMFNPLDKDSIRKITILELNKFKRNLKSEGGFELTWTEDALEFLTEQGYNPSFGARPVNRAITNHVRETLSHAILSGQVNDKTTITMDAPKGQIVFENVLKEVKQEKVEA